MAGKGKRNGGGNIVIRREEVVEGGHHGGAWKVAYADFVTAMMAFFLLMWLINATTQDQRIGLADYFAPTNVLSHQSSGVGKPFSGATVSAEGALVSSLGAVQAVPGKRPVVTEPEEEEVEQPAQPRAFRAEPTPPETRPDQQQATATPATSQSPAKTPGPEAAPPHTPRPPTPEELRAELERRERAEFEHAAQQIREVVQSDPALADLAQQLAIDITPDGLRIQLLDEDRSAMFASGSATPNDRARALLLKITPVLTKLPQPISIAGHTDAAPYRGTERSNWELSADRANATRRTLLEAGLAPDRIRTVTGHADRDLLLPADPLAAANRRIAILVQHTNRASGPHAP